MPNANLEWIAVYKKSYVFPHAYNFAWITFNSYEVDVA